MNSEVHSFFNFCVPKKTKKKQKLFNGWKLIKQLQQCVCVAAIGKKNDNLPIFNWKFNWNKKQTRQEKTKQARSG